jgi:CBS-domain-containing membrane protein
MFEGEVADRLMERLRLARWLRRFPPRLVWASFVFVNVFLAIAILTGLAVIFQTPFVFPPVGPTAFLLYFMPTTATASPRNTLCGHALGLACGYGSLCLLGLEHAPSTILEDIHWPRVLAAALSLAATGALMILFGVVHPPAGATTLIISLGFITTPAHLIVIEIVVGLMALQTLAVNRLAGIDYPLWSRPAQPAPDSLHESIRKRGQASENHGG